MTVTVGAEMLKLNQKKTRGISSPPVWDSGPSLFPASSSFPDSLQV